MALVLTLKAGDFLFIGPEITVRVVTKKGTAMSVAIEAPKEMIIGTSKGLQRRIDKQKQKELEK